MPKVKNENLENKDVIIKEKKSSLTEFTKRSLPTDNEVEEFDEIVEDEARDDQIVEGLNEIYQDEKGKSVDVSKLDIKKRHGFFYYFFTFIIFVSVFVGGGYYLYNNFYLDGTDATAVEIDVESQEKVAVGEEFFTTIYYKNLSNVSIKNVSLDVQYPENFIFLESAPEPSQNNFTWNIESVPARSSGFIKIKGKMVAEKDSNNVFFVRMRYMPENFSSEFKKEVSYTVTVSSVGLNLNLEYDTTILVGEENNVRMSFSPEENNRVDSFFLSVDQPENIEWLTVEQDKNKEENKEAEVVITNIEKGLWEISNFKKAKDFLVKYKVLEKNSEKQDIGISLSIKNDNKNFVFLKNKLSIDVLNSDLNLMVFINGSKEDQGVNFENTLSYSIVYNNKGDRPMKDVVIMAVIESDFLDWTTLKDKNNGYEKGNTIAWSKEEIPELAEIANNEEGTIDFSINVLPFRESDLGKDFQVKSYAQYSVGNKEDFKQNVDKRSNIIINKINSDLSLTEEIRYFNKDNIPVGTGPLPVKVGEETSFKVYWNIKNNLHELQDAKVEVMLPPGVTWGDKNRTSVGTVYYDSGSNKVVWQIGRLPITVFNADSEFSIILKPTEEDRNKILVLLPGSTVSATDSETEVKIEKKTQVKTTKLEDDEIAGLNTDGRVE